MISLTFYEHNLCSWQTKLVPFENTAQRVYSLDDGTANFAMAISYNVKCKDLLIMDKNIFITLAPGIDFINIL
jgi:hypothetical protein